jgi:hypothetical protein
MNLDIFNQPDPSGKLGKEPYVLKNYPEEYNFIISFCVENNLEELPFKQKVYHAIHNLKNKIKCKNSNCNNLTKYKNSTLGYYEYCSNKCISSDPNIKKIKEEKSIKKWGTKTPAESDLIKLKIKKTNNLKYGGNSPMSNDKIKEKSKITIIKNWGVDNPSKSEEILHKRVQSFKNNISSFKESYKKASIDKYGVEHPWSNPDIHKKTVDKQIESKKNILRDITNLKLLNYLNHEIVDINFDMFKRNISIKCDKEHIFEINREQLYNRVKNKSILCTVCNPLYSGNSGMEIELFNFIEKNYNLDIVANSRKIIKPFEIDIFLPNINVGFEFNGLYWHSSLQKSKDYHKNKYEKSIQNNIKLITIWEDDWVLKQDIVKSFILNKLDKTPNRIFARNCTIREVTYKESKLFLDENHLQGDCKSSIRIGLYYNDELVSLMTFSKLRLPLSQRGLDDVYELTRFCNKTYHTVVGGASKIINYFIKKYRPEEIHTYSDNMISDGNLYQKLGFEYKHTSNPGYWYVINGIRKHRFNFRKHKLVENGFDSNKTEEEIMLERGYHRIYNSGNKKWILRA